MKWEEVGARKWEHGANLPQLATRRHVLTLTKTLLSLEAAVYPRRLIVKPKSYCHVFFRCHNRQMFLKPTPIKEKLLDLIKKNKDRYKIRVYEFILMDNHAHFILGVEDAESLGNFMRTVNSQLARTINIYFKRDSQALRERYKSPIIGDDNYFIKTMQYIWLNRVRVKKKSKPQNDPYCSVSYRLAGSNCEGILDDYKDTPLSISLKDIPKIFKQAMQLVKDKVAVFSQQVFESSHTIASKVSVDYRGEYLSAFTRTSFNQ